MKRARLVAVLAAVGVGLLPPLAGLLLYGGFRLAGSLPPSPTLSTALAAWVVASALAAVAARRRSSALVIALLLGPVTLAAAGLIGLRAVKVEGESMLPTFVEGDVLLVDDFAAPGDPLAIHVLNVPGEAHNPLIKRLVGLPGQLISARYGRLFADGQEVHPRLGEAPDTWNETRPVSSTYLLSEDRRMGTDQYFFLGDNPPESRDSRHFGGVAAAHIGGRVLWRLRGPSGFGSVR
ncbi:MAG: signal peptidase I [Planctomycetes bacterium]|nr:signal peptidase I [Planctomycetota bacterium]